MPPEENQNPNPEITEPVTPDADPPDGSAPEGGGDAPSPGQFVTRSAHTRLLNDHKATKAELDRIKRTAAEENERRLREANDYKSLYENEKREKDEERQAREALNSAIVIEKKYNAVRSIALKAGLINTAEKDLELLDLSDVTVEKSETGSWSISGADEYVKNLKVIRPHWFGKGPTTVNTNAPKISSDPSSINPKKLLELSKKAKETGDYTEYKAANEAYQRAQNGRRL